MKMNTQRMEIALYGYCDFIKNTVVHNVTEASGLVQFEADIIKLTKGGYATCYEIKVSKADLRRDRYKKHIMMSDHPNYYDRWFRPIKEFYYAVPPDLKNEALAQIPKYAGLVIVKDWNTVTLIRKATINARARKWSKDQESALRRLGALRLYGHLCTIQQLKRKL